MNDINNLYNFPVLTARKAVIFARVSSNEQEEGYSIEAQLHRLEKYCQHRDLSPIQTYAIVESSTSGDRKQFMQMIKFIRSQKQPIALVADKVDRVQRSFKEYPLLDELIQQGKIELHFNTENYIIHKNSASQERLMWSMGVIMAQSYIDAMRDNVKRSIDQKIRLGEWISKAPVGYLNVKDDRGRGDVMIDPNRAQIVKRLFETYSSGAFSLSDMARKAKNWGLTTSNSNRPLARASIHEVLRNPFYYGFMKIKGQIYEHRYERLISKDLFDQCQAVTQKWHKKPFKYAGKEYTFRGLITCATTGKIVTADTKTKTNKSGKTMQWTYLRCWNPEDEKKIKWVREEVIIEQVQNVLMQIKVPPKVFEHLKNHLRETDQAERSFVRRQVSEWQKEYQICQNRLDRLMDFLIDGTIDRRDYEAKKLEIRNLQLDLEEKIKASRTADDSFKDAMIGILDIASEAHEVFNNSTIEQKRQLLNFLFANLELKGSTLCYTLRIPFDQMVKASTCQEWLLLVDNMRTNQQNKLSVVSTHAVPIWNIPII